jgi:hypothetical protein
LPWQDALSGISCLLGNFINVGKNKKAALNAGIMETLALAKGRLLLLPVPELVLQRPCLIQRPWSRLL